MKRLTVGFFAALLAFPGMVLADEDFFSGPRKALQEAKREATLDVLSAYGAGRETGDWAASVFVSRNGGNLGSRSQLHTGAHAVIQGFSDKQKCLAAGRLIALQMMHIHGETVDYEDIGSAAKQIVQNKMQHSEGTVLCLNVATGETSSEMVADPS